MISSFSTSLNGEALKSFADMEFKSFKSNLVGADPNEEISKKLKISSNECNNLGEFEDPKADIKLTNANGSIPEFLISRIDNDPNLFDKLSPDESTNNE